MDIDFNKHLHAIKLNIGYYRKKCGLTQEELAEQLGISRTHLGNIEAVNTKTGISLEMLYNIAAALNIDISKLLEIR